MSEIDDHEPEYAGYRLVINVAGPGFAEKVEIFDEDPLELVPRSIEQDGLVYERYGADDDYVEVRRDYVVARSLNPVEKPKPPVLAELAEDGHPIIHTPEET